MAPPGARDLSGLRLALLATAMLFAVAACESRKEVAVPDSPYPPGIDYDKEAVDGLEVGERLMAAGQYELALDAFTRAALDQGITPEILVGMGTANLGLGRLNQAERLLREVVEQRPDWPEAWNNLGVVLMERGQTAEAQNVFRKAYALDNGESDSIRDNLRIALAKVENPANTVEQNEEYKLVQRGSNEFLLRRTP